MPGRRNSHARCYAKTAQSYASYASKMDEGQNDASQSYAGRLKSKTLARRRPDRYLEANTMGMTFVAAVPASM